MLPIGDNNPTQHIKKPYVTYGLMIACIGIFVLEAVFGSRFSQQNIYNFAVYRALFTNEAAVPVGEVFPYLRLVSYQFLHGDIWHLAGNMLALWVVGDNVEDALGHARYLAFYLLGGIVAALGQVYFAGAPFTPMIGASGSISALFAAYLLMHPFARFVLLFFFFPITVPAIAFFGIWFAQQVFGIIGPTGSNVAWWAHLGGFAAGFLLTPLLKHKSIPFDPMFAWADVLHRTPTQKRWQRYKRQSHKAREIAERANNVTRMRVTKRPPLSPEQAAFKADYRAYLDSLLSRQEFEARWGEGSISLGRPTHVPGSAPQPWGPAEPADPGSKTAPDDQAAPKPHRRRSVMPSSNRRD